MKNKKGFTLIEMITVLVLISLIALITITSVTKLLNSSKDKLYENQMEQIESAARLWGADNMLILPNDSTSNVVCEYKNIDSCPEDYKKLIIDLKLLQDSGYIGQDIKNPKTNKPITNVTIEIEKTGKKLTYKVVSSEEDEEKYREVILNGSDPVLEGDMIPVTISNDGVVKKADITKKWYKYTDKEWANAVVLTDNSEYANGDTIPENKIKAYYVWIPRYKYQLFDNTTEAEIQISFESKYTNKSSSTTVGQYLTHPAFTYGTEELSGFWVGKFETTGTQSSPSIKPYMSGNDNSTITSLRNQKVSEQYNTAGSVSSNSTMMKNDEWGAVAYLSHSKYGLNGKVRINNNSGYKTGCGGSTDGKASAASCDIEYGKATDYPQSTTGNITGIFDMSGGAWEYMMAVRADSSGKPLSGRHNLYNSGFNGKFGCPTCDSGTSGVDSSILELTNGTNYPDSKDYNLYDNPANRDSITETNGCNGSACYGHAMNEIRKASGGNGSWYGEYSYFVSASGPFVERGGSFSAGASAGVFAFNGNRGHGNGNNSFRVVVR